MCEICNRWVDEISKIEIDGFRRTVKDRSCNNIFDVCYVRFEFSDLFDKDGNILDYSDMLYDLWIYSVINMMIVKFDDGSDIINMSNWKTIHFVNGIGRRLSCSIFQLDVSFYIEEYLSFERERKLIDLGL